MAQIQVTNLETGLTIACVQMADAHSVSVGVWVKAGARDEQEHEAGIAHFLEHLAFKGTHKRTAAQIVQEIESLGGHINAYTSREDTAYFIQLLPENLEQAVEMLSDILLHSTLPEAEIARERGVILQEIGQALDTPDDHVFELFSQACYGAHNLGRSILGTQSSVETFQKADLQGFMQRFYGAGQMVVVAAGALVHQRLEGLVGQYFQGAGCAARPSRTAPIWQSGQIIMPRDLEQCHVVFGLPAPSARAPDRYAMMVLSSLYGGGMSSRLFQQVREERGLCYSIFSFAQMMSDAGMFGVYAGTARESVGEMIDLSLAALKNCAHDLSLQEVSRAKQQIKAMILMRRDSVTSMMESSARHLCMFGEIFDKDRLIKDIDAVTRDDVCALASRLLSDPHPAMAIVGCASPPRGVKDMAEILSLG